jgi:hypothetical protein
MEGKFSQELEVLLPWMLLNRNFLKEKRHYPMLAGKISTPKYFPHCFRDSAGTAVCCVCNTDTAVCCAYTGRVTAVQGFAVCSTGTAVCCVCSTDTAVCCASTGRVTAAKGFAVCITGAAMRCKGKAPEVQIRLLYVFNNQLSCVQVLYSAEYKSFCFSIFFSPAINMVSVESK